MAKIAIIGAGGYVFPLTLVRDLLAFPALRASELALMDIDQERLGRTETAVRRLIAEHGFSASVQATTERRQALAGAHYVIITFQVGGLDAYRLDVEIPRRYGLDQTVGDTLGPGGVFRGLRTLAVLRDLAADMHACCPDALVLQYANPMAINCWALSRLGIKTVGLCHSVQGTSRMLAETLGLPYDEVAYRCAGINHQAWFLEFKHQGRDVYPLLRETMVAKHLIGAQSDASGAAYEGGVERVRTAIMATFGYFHTESSHHASEYVPYFRKNQETIDAYIPRRWDYYEICAAHDEEGHAARFLEQTAGELKPSHEYGAFIVDSIETGEPRRINGNVPNHGLIANLPQGCCVEVPCLVDASGVQPTVVGNLPLPCAALNRTNINVQELAVEAGLMGDRSLAYAAIALDPLTGALLTLPQIHAMVDDLFTAQAKWLPQFN